MAIELNGTTKIRASELNDQTISVLQPKNWIINGGFDVWQRGTSQTSSGYGSDDRWQNMHDMSTKTHSRQAFTVGQTDVPNNPTYFSRTIVVSGNASNSTVWKGQKIEDVTKLAGKIVTISFWAKADSSKNMSIFVLQNFGTGGSADVAVIVEKFALTSTWRKFTKTITIPSAVGKTIGANSFLHLHMFFDAGSAYNSFTNSLGNQSGTFDIANVSLVEGSVPVEWQTEAYADVLRQCQRYYRRYTGEANANIATGYTISSNNAYLYLYFEPMRTKPTSFGYFDLRVIVHGYSYYTLVSLTEATSTNGLLALNFVSNGSPAFQIPKNVDLNLSSSSGYLELNAEL